MFWTNNADKTPQTPEAKGRSWRVFRDVTLWQVALDSSKIWDICGLQSPQMIWDCLVANTQTRFSKPPLTDTKLRHLNRTDLAKETSTNTSAFQTGRGQSCKLLNRDIGDPKIQGSKAKSERLRFWNGHCLLDLFPWIHHSHFGC